MKGTYILAFFLIIGCGVSDTKTENSDPYLWSEYTQFDGNINSIEITAQNELYVVTEKSLYYSSDQGASFSNKKLPDSMTGRKVRVYEDEIFVIADYDTNRIDTTTYFVTVSVSALFKLENLQDEWTVLVDQMSMSDVLVLNDNIYIGASGPIGDGAGIRTLNKLTGDDVYIELFKSKMVDEIDELIIYENQILASSHDGIYASSDDGHSWNRITEIFDKDNDDFPNLDIDANNMLYAYRPKRIYGLTPDNDWHIFYLPGNYTHYDQYALIETGLVLADGHGGCFDLLELEEGELAKRTISYCESEFGNDYLGISQIEAFSNGDVAAISSERLFIGTKNPDSPFWQNRVMN